MNALFLGGNSQRHKVWIHEMADALGGPFERVVVHDYRHWTTGDQWVDIDHEIAEIGNEAANLEPYVIYAKSIGTTVTLKAMYEGVVKPKACVFLGLPLNAVADMDLPAIEWLSKVQVPVYFLHNNNDPYGSAKELKAALPANIDQNKITVLPGDTHDYTNTEVMADLLARASD